MAKFLCPVCVSVPLNMEHGQKVKALATTDDVIDSLIRLQGAGVSEIASHLDKPPSTVHNHLSTLTHLDYVTKRGQQYHVSTRFLQIGNKVRNNSKLYRISKTFVDDIAREYDGNAYLLIEEDGYAVLYYSAESEELNLRINVGRRTLLHLTAGGKAILASLPDERIHEIVDTHGLPAMSEHTITDRDELFAEIERIREQSYATADQENVEGMRGVAVSVNGTDTLPGAIQVYGPKSRIGDEKLREELPNTLMQIQETIQTNLKLPDALSK